MKTLTTFLVVAFALSASWRVQAQMDEHPIDPSFYFLDENLVDVDFGWSDGLHVESSRYETEFRMRDEAEFRYKSKWFTATWNMEFDPKFDGLVPSNLETGWESTIETDLLFGESGVTSGIRLVQNENFPGGMGRIFFTFDPTDHISLEFSMSTKWREKVQFHDWGENFEDADKTYERDGIALFTITLTP